ncbi:hypothetical protein IVB18_26210 [Bradyrhizobium sp. 186]|uniref:hypothetical protein n=1 Tax=Bradyrhizobium sp. 186 TaxID=2782654 RepID=UPI002000D4B7|nr:hypothetical protein [Bradyrhizobium sp. 186]UPK31826.1 hypothetical protein IVB18_26210 [Bradyrhizobium sp. 186]
MPFFLSPNVQVDRVNTFNSNIVLISFTERTIAPRNLSDQGFGQDFARKQAIDGFYVKCAGNHWYQYPEMLDALSAIRRAASGKDIVTYGSSMGAYAAMKFASALGAKRAVAISPIFSPDPRKPPFEGRWKTDADQIEFIDDTMIGAADTDAFVLTDPTHADARHGRLFRATFPRCTIVAVPFASHPVGHFLREAGLLGDLVKDLIFGAFDNSRWCRDRRKMRTKSPIYKSRLAEVLGERNPLSTTNAV